MGNFLGTKSWRIFLEGLKQKVDIFIETKNILTLINICVEINFRIKNTNSDFK